MYWENQDRDSILTDDPKQCNARRTARAQMDVGQIGGTESGDDPSPNRRCRVICTASRAGV